MSSGKVIVYGGRGALGSIVVEDFKKAGYSKICVLTNMHLVQSMHFRFVYSNALFFKFYKTKLKKQIKLKFRKTLS